MKVFMLYTGTGPLVILTSHGTITAPELLKRLEAKGIDKFIAYELPEALARERYRGHFEVVCSDLHETDDLRVLDFNGQRAFNLFGFDEMGEPVAYQGGQVRPAA